MKIIIILTTLFLISLPCSASPKSSSPNIVLIIADDVSAEDIKNCPFCGTPYDNQVDLEEPNFTDEFNQYDE